ncbi:MAG: hypothetical protein J2P55_02105 [Rhizobiales bacterium]|nr:hypothetical protein [Hyphomicrobiales bacterium]
MTSHDDPRSQRPEPDAATRAEIEALDARDRKILDDVLAQHPALTHKEALEALRHAGL